MKPRPPPGNRVYRKLSWTKELNRKGRKENREGRQEKTNRFLREYWVFFASFAVSFFALPRKKRKIPT